MFPSPNRYFAENNRWVPLMCIDINVLAILLQPIYCEYRFEQLSYLGNIVYILIHVHANMKCC